MGIRPVPPTQGGKIGVLACDCVLAECAPRSERHVLSVIYWCAFIARSAHRVCSTQRASRTFIYLLVCFYRSQCAQSVLHAASVTYLHLMKTTHNITKIDEMENLLNCKKNRRATALAQAMSHTIATTALSRNNQESSCTRASHASTFEKRCTTSFFLTRTLWFEHVKQYGASDNMLVCVCVCPPPLLGIVCCLVCHASHNMELYIKNFVSICMQCAIISHPANRRLSMHRTPHPYVNHSSNIRAATRLCKSWMTWQDLSDDNPMLQTERAPRPEKNIGKIWWSSKIDKSERNDRHDRHGRIPNENQSNIEPC